MKLHAIKPNIIQQRAFAGLITGAITYEIKQGTADVAYKGPFIPADVWVSVLAFFKDTYNNTKSECQVRLFCNPTLNTWAAWAFPQQINTGMTARELPCPEADLQRAQFKDSDGWYYFGTVHHHCSGGAFQSGTDFANERNQDGLHITIGKMDATHHDLHVRFYLGGDEFAPDMSLFWDIGENVRKILPPTLWDTAARFQLTTPAPGGSEYPAQWKENLIEPPKPKFEASSIGFHGGNGAGGAAGSHTSGSGTGAVYDNDVHYKRKENALRRVRQEVIRKGLGLPKLTEALLALSTDPIIEVIKEAANHHRVEIMDIVTEWEFEQDTQEAVADQWPMT